MSIQATMINEILSLMISDSINGLVKERLEYKKCLEMKKEKMVTVETKDLLFAIHFNKNELSEKTLNKLVDKIDGQKNKHSQNYKPTYEQTETVYIQFKLNEEVFVASFSK